MDDKFNGGYPLQVAIIVTSAAQLSAVYALLGSTMLGNLQRRPPGAAPIKGIIAEEGGTQDESTVKVVEEPPVAEDDSGEVDAHGHPWSAELHASTKGKTKDGLWRMKVGVSRPDPMPGFPTGTSTETPTLSATSPAATGAADAPAVEEDDEFAAFREAAKTSDATDAAAAASVKARAFSDADLGLLCNQAAQKLGDPAPIKEIIANFTPEGQVSHSRNIPEDKRADFVAAVEAKAEIEFAG